MVLTRSLLIFAWLVGCSSSPDPSGSGDAASAGDNRTTGDVGGDTGGDPASSGTAHLLITEVAVAPGAAEFVEIWNPTTAAIDMSDYYLTDNGGYTSIAAGDPWAPSGTPETDFLARFPAGHVIAADETLVIAMHSDFEATFGGCPDLFLDADEILSCNASDVPQMRVPPNGGVGTQEGLLLSNSLEMVMLFAWDGNASHLLQDVDYVTWGDGIADNPSRVDKTAVVGYVPDTARNLQSPSPAPASGESIERCLVETGESGSGGNGITGHDETSENLATTFNVQSTPTPGLANVCL